MMARSSPRGKKSFVAVSGRLNSEPFKGFLRLMLSHRYAVRLDGEDPLEGVFVEIFESGEGEAKLPPVIDFYCLKNID